MKSYIAAITGASGAVYGIRMLQLLLQQDDCTVHAVISPWAERVMIKETGQSLSEHLDLDTFQKSGRLVIHSHGDMAAAISSGSFPVHGMAVAPCSMGTLSAIASGLSNNLIERAAAVTLKERRPLVLMPRETPLSSIHLERMREISLAGGIIMPPVPAFYNHPETIDDIVDQTVRRTLHLLGIENIVQKIWRSHEF